MNNKSACFCVWLTIFLAVVVILKRSTDIFSDLRFVDLTVITLLVLFFLIQVDIISENIFKEVLKENKNTFIIFWYCIWMTALFFQIFWLQTNISIDKSIEIKIREFAFHFTKTIQFSTLMITFVNGFMRSIS